jgi:hypothetical protein
MGSWVFRNVLPHPFPLPLGEGVRHRRQVHRNEPAGSTAALTFSLSLRERAGVRVKFSRVTKVVIIEVRAFRINSETHQPLA